MTPSEAITAVETLSASTTSTYSVLKPADAVAHLNERLASECDAFERDTGLRLASIKVLRDKEADTLKALQAHVR